ncbi:hypothetical protein B0J13DRAFT_656413 [Dactylonectria estremocensis]|uniref:Uncharacterized protein n=1 Tax=Dactylonectria estremocensis TaxID=1079267 RepID=A0A9P9IAF9_9HYPO|nr:hypothetical protein B0J13DRAFT_656413 [Dactylonectria estremocensis]
MRFSHIATTAIIAASKLSQARVVPFSFKRDDDYTNEVVIMVDCDRMQDGSDTLYGTKSQMWWWSDYDSVFTKNEAVTYETAYVYAPGQNNPTYVNWTAGTTENPITADLNGEKFQLYKQAETGDDNTHVTGTGEYRGNDFTCYNSPIITFHEPVLDGIEYVCHNKYLCTRSSREITRTEIEISKGTYDVVVDGRYPMENPGIIAGYTMDEVNELSRAWAEKMYQILIEAESSGTDSNEPYPMGDSDYNMFFNIERTEKEGDAHWDANRVTDIANALGSQIPPVLVDGSHTDCYYNPKSAICSWVLPFPHQIIVKFEVASQNDPRWIVQDTFTITVQPKDGGSCSETNAIATAIAGAFAAFVGYSVPAFGAAISTFIAGAVCI